MTLTNKGGWPDCLSDLCDCIKDAIFICIFSVIVIKFQCKSQVKLISLETSFSSLQTELISILVTSTIFGFSSVTFIFFSS